MFHFKVEATLKTRPWLTYDSIQHPKLANESVLFSTDVDSLKRAIQCRLIDLVYLWLSCRATTVQERAHNNNDAIVSIHSGNENCTHKLRELVYLV